MKSFVISNPLAIIVALSLYLSLLFAKFVLLGYAAKFVLLGYAAKFVIHTLLTILSFGIKYSLNLTVYIILQEVFWANWDIIYPFVNKSSLNAVISTTVPFE